jgi:hypothetical protein
LERLEKSDIDRVLLTHTGACTFAGALHRVVNGEDLLLILGRYIQFNSIFGSSVTSLTGAIAARQDLFRDPDEPIQSIADRSVEVAADIFFAAIDEFGGHTTSNRITHRSLAQATFKATGTFFGLDAVRINKIARINDIRSAIHKVQQGYSVNHTLDQHKLFHSIGFHLGSEILADEEFRVLDDVLREKYPDLVKYLDQTKVTIGDSHYPAYRWISIHTSVEAEHFDVAMKGANHALRYYAGQASRSQIKGWIIEGVTDFTVVQGDFIAGL